MKVAHGLQPLFVNVLLRAPMPSRCRRMFYGVDVRDIGRGRGHSINGGTIQYFHWALGVCPV